MSNRRSFVVRAVVALCLINALAVFSADAANDKKSHSGARVVGLRIDRLPNPLGIDTRAPRLSWRLESDARGVLQTAYQVRVAANVQSLQRGAELIWDSGKVSSDESRQLDYPGPPLNSRTRYYWQVRVWSNRDEGRPSAWSVPAWWEMGLLDAAEWSAQWIETPLATEQAPLLRRAFAIRGDVERARIYATAHGLYQLFLNGKRVGDAELAPGYTSYNKRLLYQTYDVTPLLKNGENALGAMVGQGWYAGELGWTGKKHLYGSRTGLLMQLEIVYRDGTTERIVTDEQWKYSAGPISMADIYHGETYDARLEQPGWDRAKFDDKHWQAVSTAAAQERIVAQGSPLIRKVERILPKRIIKRPDGKTIVDLGQNMVGWVRLAAQGPAGATVTLRHGEKLDLQGSLYTENLFAARQTVQYTLKGGGPENFEPHFTYQGFQYVEVSGYPGELTKDSITGVVVSADLDYAGRFESSNPLLSRLQQNIVWSQKGNFIAIPTDNPQRHERFGWTGDALLFAPTAAFNADVSGFLGEWLKNLALDQRADGGVPWVVPDVIRKDERSMAGRFAKEVGHLMVPPLREREDGFNTAEGASTAGWGDAAIFVPWALFQSYGDRTLLRDQYESMVRWLDYERGRAGPDLIWSGDFQFGDWLDFGSEKRSHFAATDADLLATAYFARSADLLGKMAKALGKTDEAQRHARLFDDVRRAFQHKFVTADGRVGDGAQTAYALALQFDLLPKAQRASAARRLAEDVRKHGHLTTGIVGTAWLLFALSNEGYVDEAYQILMREEYPSWLYTVKRGANTIWERWDAVLPDGSFPEPVKSGKWPMNSFNQYGLGAVGNWMYRTVAGIDMDPDVPGYKRLFFKPRPGGGLTQAAGSTSTPYGEAASSWRIDGNTFELTVRIPANTTAVVSLPHARRAEVLENGHPASRAVGVGAIRQDGDSVHVEAGSGEYRFTYELTR